MRLTLPWPLRRFLLGALLCSVTMATAASGAEFVVDAAQATDPSGNVYRTLDELASSGALSSGDTVILCNDDSSLTSALNAAVHFRSNDPEVSRTIDLAGLSSSGLYDYSQFPTGEKLELNSIILCNANTGVFFISTKLTSISSEYGVVFDSNTSGYIYGGAIYHSGGRSPLTIGDGFVFTNNYVATSLKNAHGGAICNLIYPISVGAGAVFTGNYASSNSGNAYGGAIYLEKINATTSSIGCTIGDGAVFTGNYASSDSGDAMGGAICKYSTFAFTGLTIGDGAMFTGNHASSNSGNAYGGAILGYSGDSSIYDGSSLTIGAGAMFTGNYASSDSGNAHGGAIYNYCMNIYNSTFFTIGDGAVFTGNHASSNSGNAYGGAIYHSNNRGTSTIGDGAVFTGNYASSDSGDAMGGAIYYYVSSRTIYDGSPLTIGDGAVFTGNYASSNSGNAMGGAIYHSNNRGTFTIGDGAVFTGNYASSDSGNAYGGVIYSDGDISFSDGGMFTGNYAKTSGGAITMGGKCDLLALTKDALFSGNMTGGVFTRHEDGTFTVENGIANAIDMNGSLFSSLYTPNLTLAAEEGREIRFNDPITSRNEDPGRPMTLTLNRYTDGEGNVRDTEGTIVFSGELYQGEDTHLAASRYNSFLADTTLYGGALLLEHGAVFGRNPEEIMDKRYNSSLTVEKGVLEITGGSKANASSFTLSGPGAVLRPGDRAFISAHNADLSRGFTFDMRHQLQAGPAFGPGLMLSAQETFTAGGYIGVADTEANAPWFYADRSWKQDRVFHVLTDVQHIHEGDFDGAVSQATGTARVDDPYTYTGTWSHRWTDADGDGYAEQLQLVWKADGTPISRVDPELAGGLAVNSLWSSASNAAALGGNVLSRLSAPRLTDRHARNLWGMGLGDFARQRSRGGVDGYDYNGGGYSVGADSGMGGEDEGIWGIAFGQLYGHARSRDFQGHNTQDTLMGSLYWGRLMEESNRACWIFKGSLTWAETRNNMTSRLGGAPASTGKWNNETWLAQAEVSRTADCAGGWRLTPFVRMEFTHGRQDAFREQGGYGRDFGGAALKRLSIPVGLEIGRTDEWKGRPWAQSLRVSYVGDVLRDVPEAAVYSPYSDMGWRGRAVSPERHGLRAEYNTSLQCNERWSVYGGYGLEVRGSSCYHRVNAGVSRSF